jgi:hypothetical protein
MDKEKVVLSDGYEVEVDKEYLDDWDFLETLTRIDKGESGLIVDVLPLMLGAKQFEALKKHYRDKNGKLKATKMIEVMGEIIEGSKSLKNFSTSSE